MFARMSAFRLLLASTVFLTITTLCLWSEPPIGEVKQRPTHIKGDTQKLGGVFAILCKKGGKCLDANDPEVKTKGGKVQGWQYGHRENQWWEIESVSETKPHYKIVCRASKKVLDLREDEANQNGGTVQLWDYHGGKHQHWELSSEQDGTYVITNCASGKVLDLDDSQAEKDGGTIQVWKQHNGENQRWVLFPVSGVKNSSMSAEGSHVETITPIGKGHTGNHLQIVWIDPERKAMVKELQTSDIVRFEYPDNVGEIPWSNTHGSGGLDTQLIPHKDLIFRVYRPRMGSRVPHFVSEIPVQDKDNSNKPFYWRSRDKNMMPVPLFFVGDPVRGERVDLGNNHKGLSVAYLGSPYDTGVVLSSPEALLLVRTRLLMKHDWVAVDLHVYNIYGPPLGAPPRVSVRVEGGEQLADFPKEDVDKIIPDNDSFGEFRSKSITFSVGADLSGKPLGIGFGMSYTTALTLEKGEYRGSTRVHPERWKLFTRAWDASALDVGSFRGGRLLFKPPQSKSIRDNPSATVSLKTAYGQDIAHLEYSGRPPSQVYVALPGSAVSGIRYEYSKPPTPITNP